MKAGLLAIAAGLMLLGGAQAQADQTVVCQSMNYQQAACRFNARGGARVTLSQQLSNGRGACIEGQTYSYDSNTIYVSGGCRAVFTVSEFGGGGNGGGWPGGGHGGGWPGGGHGGGHDRVICESINYSANSCYVGRIRSVYLDQQLSTPSHHGGSCQQGRDWSYDNNTIYVNRGCRAVFAVERD
jgi:hypothetical protein